MSYLEVLLEEIKEAIEAEKHAALHRISALREETMYKIKELKHTGYGGYSGYGHEKNAWGYAQVEEKAGDDHDHDDDHHDEHGYSDVDA